MRSRPPPERPDWDAGDDLEIGQAHQPETNPIPKMQTVMADPEVIAAFGTATREPFDTAPKHGRQITAYFGPDDFTGRPIMWREGRVFLNRRWQNGGKWVPLDLMPMLEEPTEWLHRPEDDPTLLELFDAAASAPSEAAE